jgi:Amt family ammonium transporter
VTGSLAPDNTAPLTGLFYGGGAAVLKAQLVGSLIVTVATFSVAMAVMYAIKAAGVLRVSAEGEAYGLDLHEHGISAYPEYVISAMGRPAGMLARDPDKHGAGAPAHLGIIEPTV